MLEVYLIHNISNKKYYVGYTELGFETRWKFHCYDAKYSQQRLLQRAIKKYGKGKFVYEILSKVKTVEEAKLLEKLWIVALRSYDPKVGYNMTYGGDGNHPTVITRQKMSKAQKGKKHSQITIQRRVQSLLDRNHWEVNKEPNRRISKSYFQINSNHTFKRFVFKGTIWATDGVKNLRLISKEVLPVGFRFGRTNKKKLQANSERAYG